jgi:hypothetical protein
MGLARTTVTAAGHASQVLFFLSVTYDHTVLPNQIFNVLS